MTEWMHAGLSGGALADLRMKADKLMCNGQFDAGKLLHKLLDTAGKGERLIELQDELEEATSELRTKERDLEYAEDAARRVQQRLDQFKEDFMGALDELVDEGKLEGKAFDKLQQAFKEGLEEATGPLYDIG